MFQSLRVSRLATIPPHVNHLWLYKDLHDLYRFYIPELIRLANVVQTTQVQELLIQLKLLPHHTVKLMLKYLVRQMQAHNVWQWLCRHLFKISGIQ